MSNFFKCNLVSLLAVGSCLGLMGGCGGGNGSGINTPNPSGTPSSFDGIYQARVTPTDAVPGDGQAPGVNLSVQNGTATTQFTFFLQPSVVTQVQAAIDSGLTSAGFASAISDNQVPTSIEFAATGQVDGSGRAIFAATRDVSVCGTATLALDSTLSSTAGTEAGTGNYNLSFPDNLTLRVRGRSVAVEGTCNNLPLRAGTIAFSR